VARARAETIVGTSFESFADAAQSAFAQVEGDPGKEGAAAAEVVRMTLTKGGIVGRTQYHVEIRKLTGPRL
jgi:flavin-binding protein dodecin